MESKVNSNNGNHVLLISIRNTRRCSIQVKSIFFISQTSDKIPVGKMPRFEPGWTEYWWWVEELLLKSRQQWRDQYQLTVSWQIFSAFRLGQACRITSTTSSLSEGWTPLHLHNNKTTQPRSSLSFPSSEVQRSKHLAVLPALIFIWRGLLPPVPSQVVGGGHYAGGDHWVVRHCDTATLRVVWHWIIITILVSLSLSLSLSSCWGCCDCWLPAQLC